jgi:hypothetical protein
LYHEADAILRASLCKKSVLIEQKTHKKKDIPVPPAAKKVFAELDDGSTGYLFLSSSNRNQGGVRKYDD